MLNDKCEANCGQRLSAIEEAFPLDDLGKPGFHEHRKGHLKEIQESERMEEIKDAATSQILLGLLGVALTAIAAWLGFR